MEPTKQQQEQQLQSNSLASTNEDKLPTSEIQKSSLKFATFRSFVDSAFFHELSNLKLNKIKLDEAQIPLLGSYSISATNNSHSENSNSSSNQSYASLSVSKSGFSTEDFSPFHYTTPSPCVARGSVLNVNTIETFKTFNRVGLIRDTQQNICDDITSGAALADPSLLSRFVILNFSDLKKYSFYYWFAFPAPLIDWKADQLSLTSSSLLEISPDMYEAIETWKKEVEAEQWGFFLLKKSEDPEETTTGEEKEAKATWKVTSLQNHESFLEKSDNEKSTEQYLAFVDPSPHELVPGWPLRNFLLLAFHYNLFNKYPGLKVLAYRGNVPRASGTGTSGKLPTNGSFVIEGLGTSTSSEGLEEILKNVPKATGWERLATTGKLSPKHTSLGSLIDPVQLADQAVDLNLKLMKWRIVPELNLDIVKETKCLLLGAGTLGSYIARALLGWGVRKITFVDSGTVSYSNPVRQPLFEFTDCQNGGKPKAQCAADALRRIYPSVDSQGYRLEIPMAGHAVHDEEHQRRDYETLQSLIQEHDVVFLLMDSRESRWLPTVMCAAQSKLVINAALGFDSYVVMRHGIIPSSSPLEKEEEGEKGNSEISPHLGCYFCNDVVAPLDSLSNRTLDQMCTVTRPGVAMLASANAVEMLVSVLQHPLKGLAPPPPPPVRSNNTNENDDNNNNKNKGESNESEQNETAVFGYNIPHQLRGFLGSFDSMKVTGCAYPSCSACSAAVRNEWKSQGWDFVRKALNDPKYVEELSGLAEVQRMTEALTFDDDDDDGSDSWALSD